MSTIQVVKQIEDFGNSMNEYDLEDLEETHLQNLSTVFTNEEVKKDIPEIVAIKKTRMRKYDHMKHSVSFSTF